MNIERCLDSWLVKKDTGHRGHGEGSITQCKDGRFQIMITLESGQRKYYYADSKKEAMRS
ncbi:hypothetical protein KDA_19050 [Dictyobacter alpinus]|uniref:Uncharacterized protein n=1 Tax=Dictyobacter alpinus TaxID=2014873 RepID=A0A402B4Z9_9CHLR|nr:hypothetical protein KDA_19050 [Dictyobacter alpinus]